jgi:hypothetical protein
MVDIKYPVSGSIRVWWTPTNGFANWKAPTAAELTASMDISDSISWNDKDFGVQASNTVSDPAITATGNAQTRGAAQYGGSFSFYYPKVFNDATNLYSLVYDALRLPNTEGYITVRVDGLALDQAAGTAAQPGRNAEAGDQVNVFRVATAGYAESITGEEAFRYTVSFLPRGQVQTFAVVRANATPVAPVVTGVTTLTIATKYAQLDATIVGRKATRGVTWTTSTPSFATISANGIVKALAAGTASFLATDPATNTPSTAKTITIS